MLMRALISIAGRYTFKASDLCSFVLWWSCCHKGEAVVLSRLDERELKVLKALEIANIHNSQHRKLLVASSGVVFLGSPLQGTKAGKAAEWQAMLGAILNKGSSQTLLQDLDGSTRALRETSEKFVTMVTTPPMQTMTMCFWESKKTQVLKAVLPARILTLRSSVKMIVSHYYLDCRTRLIKTGDTVGGRRLCVPLRTAQKDARCTSLHVEQISWPR